MIFFSLKLVYSSLCLAATMNLLVFLPLNTPLPFRVLSFWPCISGFQVLTVHVLTVTASFIFCVAFCFLFLGCVCNLADVDAGNYPLSAAALFPQSLHPSLYIQRPASASENACAFGLFYLLMYIIDMVKSANLGWIVTSWASLWLLKLNL